MDVAFTMTVGIRDRMINDKPFHSAVIRAMKRFAKKDWGDVDLEDADTNDQMHNSLDMGGGGMVLGSYGRVKKDTIWIIRDSERITVLFPDEY